MMVEHGDLHVARLGLPLGALQVTVDFLCGLFAIRHRTDDQARAKGDVACGEDAGRRGFERVGIDLDRTLPCGLYSVLRLQEREVGGLPDGQNRGIDIQNALRSGLENRIEAVLGVEYRSAVNCLEPCQLPVLTDKPPGAARRMNLQAFVEGLINLFFEGRHFGTRFQAHHVNFPRAQTQRGAGDIHQLLHRHVAFRVREPVREAGICSGVEGLGLLLAQAPCALRQSPRCLRRSPPRCCRSKSGSRGWR